MLDAQDVLESALVAVVMLAAVAVLFFIHVG